MSAILMIPTDGNGNKLFIKDLRSENKRLFVSYKSTYNDIPFTETELFLVDMNKNCAITGDDGTILYRFSVEWIHKLLNSAE